MPEDHFTVSLIDSWPSGKPRYWQWTLKVQDVVTIASTPSETLAYTTNDFKILLLSDGWNEEHIDSVMKPILSGRQL